MQVTISIPQIIVDQCHECGYDEETTKILFLRFLNDMMFDGYGQFHTDFDIWLQQLDDTND